MKDLHQLHKEHVFESELVEHFVPHGWKEDFEPATTKNWLSIQETFWNTSRKPSLPSEPSSSVVTTATPIPYF